jgi:hypothetical protein
LGFPARDDLWEQIKPIGPGAEGKRARAAKGGGCLTRCCGRPDLDWPAIDATGAHDIITDEGGEPVIPPRRHRK